MVRIPQFLTAALAITGASAASAVKDLLPSNFDDIVLNSGKPALVEFFAPWCGHCKTLAPIYEELASAFESQSDKVTIAKVDADAHKELGRKWGVQGFPTLKWFDGKSATPEDYKSGRDLESLTAFINGKTGIKPKAKKAAPSSPATSGPCALPAARRIAAASASRSPMGAQGWIPANRCSRYSAHPST